MHGLMSIDEMVRYLLLAPLTALARLGGPLPLLWHVLAGDGRARL